MTRDARLVMLSALLALTACGGQDGDYPALLPTDRILAEPALPAHAAEAAASPTQVDDEAAARAAALRRRAEALRGPVIEPELRDRMQAVE